MENTYTWIEAREVATNGSPNDQRKGFERSKKNISWDNNKGQKNRYRFSPYRGSNHRHHIKKAVKSRQLDEWKKKEKDITPTEAPILMISRGGLILKKKAAEESSNKVGEITFPPVSSVNFLDPVIIKAQISGRQGTFLASRRITIGNYNRTAMHRMGIIVSTTPEAITFLTPRGTGIVFLTRDSNKIGEEQERLNEAHQETIKGVLSCVDAEERIVINRKYPDQTIIIGKQVPTALR
nr:hypothetical protein [Tanacetum cinerariifolium]